MSGIFSYFNFSCRVLGPAIVPVGTVALTSRSAGPLTSPSAYAPDNGHFRVALRGRDVHAPADRRSALR